MAISKDTKITLGVSIALASYLVGGLLMFMDVRATGRETIIKLDGFVQELKKHESAYAHDGAIQDIARSGGQLEIMNLKHTGLVREVERNLSEIGRLNDGQKELLIWTKETDGRLLRIEDNIQAVLKLIEKEQGQ